MSKIKILPEILSNKIAAGEVVERPASVVKELLENSLDAYSQRIIIDIEKGGRSLIRISDDGEGMSFDDALLSIERYATSKITKDPDLFSIQTLGFRGEALPSIASVSKMTLITRQKEEELGGKVQIKGGAIINAEPCGAPAGTMISVNSLFFNMPARRKFLKTINTEMGHIGDTVSQMAMGWPNVYFKLNHNGKSVKAWSASSNSIDRVADILGRSIKNDLIPISYEHETLEISGWLGLPRQNRSTSKGIYIYVNNRFIKDRILQHALFEGYRGRLVKGQYPVAVLFLKVPFDEVDVNVHPTKHEVRFAHQRFVHDTVRDVVGRALKENAKPSWQGRTDSSRFSDSPQVNESVASYQGQTPAGSMKNSSILPKNGPATIKPLIANAPESASDNSYSADNDIVPLDSYESEDDKPQYQPSDFEKPEPRKRDKDAQLPIWKEKFFSDLRVIGQYANTYIVCESKKGLLLIDQHAAHERISFERLQKKAGKGNTPSSQRLLIPETVELSFKEADKMEELIPELKSYGLDVEPFGGQTFMVTSVPTLLTDLPMEDLIRQIAEKAVDMGTGSNIEKIMDAALILMACHTSIRAHQKLSPEELKEMLSQLDTCENPYHCPHGRPTYIEWSKKDVEKLFHRII